MYHYRNNVHLDKFLKRELSCLRRESRMENWERSETVYSAWLFKIKSLNKCHWCLSIFLYFSRSPFLFLNVELLIVQWLVKYREWVLPVCQRFEYSSNMVSVNEVSSTFDYSSREGLQNLSVFLLVENSSL